MKNVPIPMQLSGLINSMPPEDAGYLLKRIVGYAEGNPELSESVLAEGAFSLVKPAIDKALAASERHRESGKSGGRPKKEEPVIQEQIKAEPKEAKRFAPPTLEEVAAYCRERNNGIDPETFVDHYTANGWRQGKGAGRPIKDWKACIRTWENSRKNEPQVGPNGVKLKPVSEQLHDLDDLF